MATNIYSIAMIFDGFGYTTVITTIFDDNRFDISVAQQFQGGGQTGRASADNDSRPLFVGIHGENVATVFDRSVVLQHARSV